MPKKDPPVAQPTTTSPAGPKVTQMRGNGAGAATTATGAAAAKPRVDGMKINIYGESKVGKTRLLCSFPKPLLVIGQDGSKSVANGKIRKTVLPSGCEVQTLLRTGQPIGVDLVRIRNTKDFDEALAYGIANHYATIGTDTAGDLQAYHVKEVLNLSEVPAKLAYGMADRGTWGAIGQLVMQQLTALLNLTETHGIHTPVIAHERNFKDDDETKGYSDLRIKPKIGSAVLPAVKLWLDGACDYICQCYIGEQKTVSEVDDGFGGKQIVETPTGKFEYRLRIGRHSLYTTGFRCLGDELPDSIVNPTYEKIVKVILGEKVS